MVAGARTLAETSTLRTGSNPAILFYLATGSDPSPREDIRSIQALHSDRGRILVSRDTTPLERPPRVNWYDPTDLEDAYRWAGVFGISKLSKRDQAAAKKRVAELMDGLGLGVPETDKDFDEALSSPFTQGKPDTPCLNPKCSDRKAKGQLIPIALVPAEPVKGLHTFGRWGGGVQLIFRMCPKCYTIRVSNQCD